MYCTKCGEKNNDNAKFCRRCGASTADDIPDNTPYQREYVPVYPAASAAVPPIAVNVAPRKKHTALKVISVLTVIAIVCTGLLFVFQKSDEEKIEALFTDFEEAYNGGDFDAVSACFEPRAQKAVSSAMGLGSSMSGISIADLFGLAYAAGDEELDFTVTDIKFSDDEKTKAEVTVNLCYGDSDKGDNTVEVVKIKGKWYIGKDELF